MLGLVVSVGLLSRLINNGWFVEHSEFFKVLYFTTGLFYNLKHTRALEHIVFQFL